MIINIISRSMECFEELKHFKLIDSHSMQLEYMGGPLQQVGYSKYWPYLYGDSSSYTKNKFGWKSWIEIDWVDEDTNNLNELNNGKENVFETSFHSNPNEKQLNNVTFQLDDFLKNNEVLDFEKIKSLFYHNENKYEFYSEYLKKRERLGINKNSIFLTLGFNFFEHFERGSVKFSIEQKDITDSYTQLKIFYSSFINQYDSSILFLRSPRNPEMEMDSEDDLFPLNKYKYIDGQALMKQVIRDEQSAMDQDSDGSWRWNID